MPSTDPIDMLVEIAQLTMDRMNATDQPGPQESFTLGQIMGIASRRDEILPRLNDPEEASNA